MRRTREELAAQRSGRSGVDVGLWAALAFPALLWLGLVVGGVSLLWQGLGATAAELSGVRGEVTVTRCVPSAGADDEWSCSGPFVADGDRFRIPQVTIEPPFHEPLTGSVEALVTGADASVAWTPSMVPFTATGGGLAFLGLAGWGVWIWFRPDDAEEGLSKRARRRLARQRRGPAGPPQVGNRTRSRRRRRRRRT